MTFLHHDRARRVDALLLLAVVLAAVAAGLRATFDGSRPCPRLSLRTRAEALAPVVIAHALAALAATTTRRPHRSGGPHTATRLAQATARRFALSPIGLYRLQA